MTTFGKRSAQARPPPRRSSGAREIELHPLYRITSGEFLEALYFLCCRAKGNGLALDPAQSKANVIWGFNLDQFCQFFENIFRKKHIHIWNSAVPAFVEKHAQNHYRRPSPGSEQKTRAKNRGADPEPPSAERHCIAENPAPGLSLEAKLLRSIRQGNPRGFVSNFQSKKQRLFESSARGELAFGSPEAWSESPKPIGNEAFLNIELSTVKKRNFCKESNPRARARRVAGRAALPGRGRGGLTRAGPTRRPKNRSGRAKRPTRGKYLSPRRNAPGKSRNSRRTNTFSRRPTKRSALTRWKRTPT